MHICPEWSKWSPTPYPAACAFRNSHDELTTKRRGGRSESTSNSRNDLFSESTSNISEIYLSIDFFDEQKFILLIEHTVSLICFVFFMWPNLGAGGIGEQKTSAKPHG